MSASTNVSFTPQIPTLYLDSTSSSGVSNNVKAIITKAIDLSNKYNSNIINVKIKISVYTSFKPSFSSDTWFKGLIFLQNQNLNFDEIGTVIGSTYQVFAAGTIFQDLAKKTAPKVQWYNVKSIAPVY